MHGHVEKTCGLILCGEVDIGHTFAGTAEQRESRHKIAECRRPGI